jgi:hypothetical protein
VSTAKIIMPAFMNFGTSTVLASVFLLFLFSGKHIFKE